MIGPAQIVPAVGAWAGAALALGIGWRTGAVAAAVSATALVGVAAAMLRSARLASRLPRLGLVALALFAVSATTAAARAHEAEAHPLAQLARAGERDELLVTVWTTDDPRPVRGNRVLVPARLRSPWDGASVVVVAPKAQYEALVPWQTATFRAKAAPPRRNDLTVASLTAVGPRKRWARLRGRLGRRAACGSDSPPCAGGCWPKTRPQCCPPWCSATARGSPEN